MVYMKGDKREFVGNNRILSALVPLLLAFPPELGHGVVCLTADDPLKLGRMDRREGLG